MFPGKLLAAACLLASMPGCTWRLGYTGEDCGAAGNCGTAGSGGSGGIGAPCQDASQCQPLLQCSSSVCTCPGGTSEVCGDGVDNNCSGVVNEACGPCDTLRALADNFDDGQLGPVWELAFSAGGATLTEAGGQIVINLGSSNGNQAGMTTLRDYVFPESELLVEVVDPGTVPDVTLHLALTTPNYDLLVLHTEAGVLTAYSEEGSTFTSQGSVSFDATAHRWWRIGHHSGQVQWATSPDGSTWTSLASWTPTFDVSRVFLDLSANLKDDTAAPQTVRLDWLNGGAGNGGFNWCPASTIREDFDGGPTSTEWVLVAEPGFTAEIAGGVLRTALGVNVGGDASGFTYDYFDLTNDEVRVEVPVVPASLDATTWLLLSNDGDGLALELYDGDMKATQQVGYNFTTLASTPYNATAHRFWKIASTGGQASWETSPDGVVWTTLHETANPVAVDALRLILKADLYASEPTPGEAHFDNVNLP